ncbi:sigma-70 family RNA polymerase sigma factor [Gammaproteobacteria bacterium]|nr:sigma-70 family RNA polymerase sigma factor [Gammaproteobacteria bacterium]MDB9896987.1 sigma-70 family RNA polymerase sigma factor [Gammaproteobacteria bacterium]
MSTFEEMLFSDSLKIKMINVAKSRTFNEADAFDLIQNSYLKAIERKDQFEGDNIDPWVIRILCNSFIDSTRKKKEELMGDDLPEIIVNEDSESSIIESELEQESNECMKTLSNEERDVIALHQTSSYDEISKVVNIKSGTLRQMLRRAKEKFMQCMGFDHE